MNLQTVGFAIVTLLVLPLAACSDGPPEGGVDGGPPPVDTALLDGARVDQTMDAQAPDDAGQDDTRAPDAEAPQACSSAAPDGVCPAGRSCRAGACIVDVDPGTPLSDPLQAVALFDQIWAAYDKGYGAFPAKSVDWEAVNTTYRPLVAAAKTEFEASWLVARAVAEIGDGHTAVVDPHRCELTQGFGAGYANVGACVVESAGKLIVYKTVGGSGFALGDALVEIDGRTAEQLIDDLDQQPRCSSSYSSAAQHRAALVASLLFRPGSDKQATVIGADGASRTVALKPQPSPLSCDDRVGLAGLTSHAHGILSKTLTGDVHYVRLPMFGGYDGLGNFVIEPVIAALRQAFEPVVGKAGLILDLRANPGGSPQVYLAVASWLLAAETTLFTCQEKSGPGHADHGPTWPMKSAPDPSLQYAGPVAVLVSARTFSAGDFCSGFLAQTERAKLFGAPSGGGFGNGATGGKIGQWTLAYNNILCRGLDGEILEGHPPAVDVAVTIDRADAASGVDTVVERARAWIASGAP